MATARISSTSLCSVSLVFAGEFFLWWQSDYWPPAPRPVSREMRCHIVPRRVSLVAESISACLLSNCFCPTAEQSSGQTPRISRDTRSAPEAAQKFTVHGDASPVDEPWSALARLKRNHAIGLIFLRVYFISSIHKRNIWEIGRTGTSLHP